MTEIKFKAWHIKLGEYITGFFIRENNQHRNIYQSYRNVIDDMSCSDLNEDVILEQYSGIKDKNDKEIYFLSDIVRATITDDLMGDVTFFDGVLYLCLKTYRIVMRGHEEFNLIFAEEFEIIGNIHKEVKNDSD